MAFVKTTAIMPSPTFSPKRCDDTHHPLAVALNNVGALHHEKGNFIHALQHFQEAVQVLIEALREQTHASSPACEREMNVSRLASIASEEQGLQLSSRPTQAKLDIYPRGGSKQDDELDAAFLPISSPIKLDRQDPAAPQPRQIKGEDENCLESAIILFNMGLTHLRGHSMSKATRLLSMSMSILRKTMDPALGARVCNNLALAQAGEGLHSRAMQSLEEALDLWGQAAGSNDEEGQYGLEIGIADTLSLMGRMHYLDGQQNKALELCHQALRLRRSALGDEDAQVASTLYNIGLILWEQGHTESALEHCQWFVNMAAVSSKPEFAPHKAEALHTLGLIHLDNDNVSDAIKTFTETVKLRKAVYGAHPTLSDDLLQLGRIFHDVGKFQEAMEQYRHALAVETALASQDSPSDPENSEGMVTVLCSIGQVHQALGQLDAALAVYERVLRAARSIFGDEDEFVASILNVIGNVHLERGETEDAVANFADSTRIIQRLQEQGQVVEGTSNGAQGLVVVPNILQAMGLEFYPHAAAA